MKLINCDEKENSKKKINKILKRTENSKLNWICWKNQSEVEMKVKLRRKIIFKYSQKKLKLNLIKGQF